MEMEDEGEGKRIGTGWKDGGNEKRGVGGNGKREKKMRKE